MKCQQVRYRPILVVLLLLLPSLSLANVDSIINRIIINDGELRLQAYEETCRAAATQNNIENELLLLSAYQDESARQNNVDHQTQARTLRLYTFYNNNLSDSLDLYIDEHLSFMEKYEKWISYYSCRSLVVERLLYDKKLHTALREAEMMYDIASHNNTRYGKGVSAYLIGSCYQSMGRHKEASQFFEQAETELLPEENIGQLHNLYAMAWQSLAHTKSSDRQIDLTDRWEAMWQEYCEKNKLQLSDIAPYYMVCVLARVDVHIKKKEMLLARQGLDLVQQLSHGQRDITKLLLLKYEAIYNDSIGDHTAALQCLKERYSIQLNLDNMLNALETLQMSATILTQLGRYEEAASIYEVLLPQKDSITHTSMTAQLDELALLYNVNTLESDKIVLRFWLNIMIGMCVILILFLICYAYYRCRINAKNKIIYQKIQAQAQIEKRVKILEESVPIENRTNDEILFHKVKELLRDPKIIADDSLDRTRLAQILGTNSNYLAAAIKNESGLKVMEFINKTRIDFACVLLKDDNTVFSHHIWEICGFSSRSTFYRLFKSTTGLTPQNYKETAK